jgi:glycosyltransferase involved in cell wall biosynthesis
MRLPASAAGSATAGKTLEGLAGNQATAVQERPPGQTRPIRVLVVAARFLPELGGIENHVHEVTSRLAKRSDFEFTVLTTDRSGRLPDKEEFPGFTVLRRRAYPRGRDYYISPGVYRFIMSGDYDFVHCQGIHTAVPVLAMTAARRRRIPYGVTLHTGGHSSGVRHRLRNLQWRTLGPLLRQAKVVVAVSRFEKQLIQEACHLDESRLRLVQNGGDLPADLTRPQPVPGRIISCGRLERYKGHQRVIEALPIVQQAVPAATLHILGAGPYEAKLRALVKALDLERSVTIEYVAPEDRRRMAESLRQAAVFAALSEYEAHPVAVMEALALGIPTIGLNSTGIGDLVEDGLVTGVPTDASPAAVAKILVSTLQSRGPRGAAELPTWDLAALDIAGIYRDAVGAGPAPRSPYDA